jgi:hypothetical protein
MVMLPRKQAPHAPVTLITHQVVPSLSGFLQHPVAWEPVLNGLHPRMKQAAYTLAG